MIVQYASDLHLDYGQNYEYILNKGFEEEGNVLILAGDVANLVSLRTYRLFWDLCSSNFEKTIFVPGNHDYYGEWEKVEDLIEPIKIPIRPNVLCCNNEVVRVGDTDFICSTLWSNIIPEQSAAVNSILLDFNEITFDGRKISVDEYVAMHKESLAFCRKPLPDLTPNTLLSSRITCRATHCAEKTINTPLFHLGLSRNWGIGSPTRALTTGYTVTLTHRSKAPSVRQSWFQTNWAIWRSTKAKTIRPARRS